MKTLLIVARYSMLAELEVLLHDQGITAYTIFRNVTGRGVTGKVLGTFLQPDINCIILAVLPSERVERAVNALKAVHAARATAAHAQPLPLKVFSFPCEEHI